MKKKPPRHMRVLICGGREYRDAATANRVLDHLDDKLKFTRVITGGAAGADQLGDFWAERAGIDRIVFPANWRGRGLSAGPYRNQLMIDLTPVDLVIAFPGRMGTLDMKRRAKARGIKIIEIDKHGKTAITKLRYDEIKW